MGLLEFSSYIGSSTGYFGASGTTSSLVGTGIVVRGYPVEKNAQMWSMSGSIAASGTFKGRKSVLLEGEALDEMVQDTLDAIEYAIGSKAVSYTHLTRPFFSFHVTKANDQCLSL